MAQLTLTVAGLAVGSYFGGPVGASIGATLGATIGGYIDSLWMGGKNINQPSYADTQIQGASYGKPIPNCYGTIRLAGELIWSGGIIEHPADQSVGGAKGLGGGSSVDSTYYTASFAVGLCAGPIAGIRRVWADKKILGDFSHGSYSVLMRGGQMHIYLGTEDQLPSGFMQQARGLAYVPGFRGLAYLIIENIQLQDFANHIPQIEAEVIVPGSDQPQSALIVNGLTARSGFNNDILDLARHVYYSIGNPFTVPGSSGLVKLDAFTGAILASNNAIPGDGVTDRGGFSLGSDGNLYFVSDILVSSIPGSAYRACLSRINQHSLTISYSTPTGSAAAPIWWPGFIRNRYGYAILSTPKDGLGQPPAVNIIAETAPAAEGGPIVAAPAMRIVVSSYPMPGGGMADLDASLNVWYFCRVGTGSTRTAVIYQYTFNPAGAEGQTLTQVASWDVTSAFAAPPSGSGSGCCCMYLPDQHALLLSVDGKTLVKWDVALQTVTGAETTFGAAGGLYWGGVGQFGTWQQGEVNGQIAIYAGGQEITIIDVANWELVQTVNLLDYEPPLLGSSFESGIQYDQDDGWIYLTQIGASNNLTDMTSGMARIDLNRLDPAYTTLGQVVSDICLRCGFDSSEFNVSQLTQLVRGYAIGRVTDGTASLQPLMDSYFFDAVESDGLVKFINRGAGPAATITKDDLGAYDAKSQRPDPLEIDDSQAEDLPALVEVAYIDQGMDYDRGLQAARRIQNNGLSNPQPSRTKKPIDLPIVFLPTEAKQIADIQLTSEWIARQTYKFSLSRKWLALDPTDVVQISKDSNSFVMRLTQTDLGANGQIQVQAVADYPKVYDMTAVVSGPPGSVTSPATGGSYDTNAVGIDAIGRGAHGDSGSFPTAVDTFPLSPTILELFDTPALRDEDATGAGFYMAGGPSIPARKWTGAVVNRSVDGGASYQPWESINIASGIGFTTTALPAPPVNQFSPGGAWATWDMTSTVTVRMVSGSDQMASAPNELAVLNGANAALVGSEVIQFLTATANADGSFTLGGGMTRGRRGTDPWIGRHAAGELFVLLNPNILQSISEDTGQIGLMRQYQGISLGESPVSESAIAFADQGNRLKPYAVGHVTGARDGSQNLTISWIRRTRSGGDNSWLDGVIEVPLAEASENYSIDILNGTGAVVRTLSAISPSVVYSAAQQTTDFGSAQASVNAEIYQLSTLVGRGFGASATI